MDTPADPESLMFRSRVYALISASILVFDHLQTLDKEINLVWKRGVLNIGGIFFLTNRYSPYIYVFGIINEYWSTAPSQNACRAQDIWIVCFLSVSLWVSEIIISLRTWAIWNKSRRIVITFLVVVSYKIPLLLVALYETLKHSEYIDLASGGTICITPAFLKWEFACLGLLLSTETLVAILTTIKAVKAEKSSSRWYFRVHYAGIYYYFFNLTITVCNLAAVSVWRNMGIYSFLTLQGVFLAALCSRVIFIAREPSELTMNTADDDFYSALAYERGDMSSSIVE